MVEGCYHQPAVVGGRRKSIWEEASIEIQVLYFIKNRSVWPDQLIHPEKVKPSTDVRKITGGTLKLLISMSTLCKQLLRMEKGPQLRTSADFLERQKTTGGGYNDPGAFVVSHAAEFSAVIEMPTWDVSKVKLKEHETRITSRMWKESTKH